MDTPTFDELKDLAQSDPEGFEQLRAELLNDCIRQSPQNSQRRMQGLKFVIDARRRVVDSPMKALLDVQGMMYDSCFSLQKTLQVWKRLSEPSVPASTRIPPFQRSPSSLD